MEVNQLADPPGLVALHWVVLVGKGLRGKDHDESAWQASTVYTQLFRELHILRRKLTLIRTDK